MFGLLEGLSGNHFGALYSELRTRHSHISRFTYHEATALRLDVA